MVEYTMDTYLDYFASILVDAVKTPTNLDGGNVGHICLIFDNLGCAKYIGKNSTQTKMGKSTSTPCDHKENDTHRVSVGNYEQGP